MLNKSLIGKKEKRLPFSCEKCGLQYDDIEDNESIDETGKCRECNK